MEFLEVVRKNFANISIAKRYGFFSENKDISLCNDASVVYWINDIIRKDISIEKYVKEILPKFKTWSQNGVKNIYVGKFYDFLISAENNGFIINQDTCNYLITLTNFISKQEVFEKARYFESLGFPLNYALAVSYQDLCILEAKKMPITSDIIEFIYTAREIANSKTDILTLFKIKEEIETRYNYQTNNAFEILKLYNYNTDYSHEELKKLREKSQSLNNIIRNSNDQINSTLEAYFDDYVEVKYIQVLEDGSIDKNIITGILKGVNLGYLIEDFGGITLESASFRNSRIVYDKINLKNKEDIIIFSIISNDEVIYKCPIVKERITEYKISKKVNEVKKELLLEEYQDKYNTLEGFTYLDTQAKEFIKLITSECYPINNLFAYCFEIVFSNFSKCYNGNDLLSYTLYVYQYILNENNKEENIKHFLDKNILERVINISNYVISNNLLENDTILERKK